MTTSMEKPFLNAVFQAEFLKSF